MKVSGAEAMVRALEHQGVTDIFGIPGGSTLPLYDALSQSKKIRHYLMRHEQVAAHAADGYARVTGRVGVCMATSGPGATNLVTGIANAYMDSIPIVAITGQVPTTVIGTDAFQEADITGITLPIVKHSYLITDASEIAEVVAEAFHIASTGRPGPVVIDFPRNVQQQQTEYRAIDKVNLPGYRPTVKGHMRQIKAAYDAIVAARRPVLYVGGGVNNPAAAAELEAFATRLRIPVTWTLLGKGVFPEDHELNMGMIGMHGTKTSNLAIQNADLIIAIGVRFDDRATGNVARFAPQASVIHIDVDPAEISKVIKALIPIVGDARHVLKSLNDLVREKNPSPDYAEWLAQIAAWKDAYPLKVPEEHELKPQVVISKLNSLLAGTDFIVTTGVGQHQMWAAQFMKVSGPRRFVTSGGLGTMGFGMPSAIGAQVGAPTSTVVDIDGDGSFQMVLQDLGTIARYNLPVKMVIMNNRYLGMVRQWQELFYGRRYFAVDLDKGSPDFEKLGEAYGIAARSVTRYEDVEEALATMLAHKGPYILDVQVTEEENVFPMVAPGAALDEILGVD